MRSSYLLATLGVLWIFGTTACSKKDSGPAAIPNPSAKALSSPPAMAVPQSALPRSSRPLPASSPAAAPASVKAPTFDGLDRDRDGVVSKPEFLAYHAERMTSVFGTLDRNGNGTLEKTELGSLGVPPPAGGTPASGRPVKAPGLLTPRSGPAQVPAIIRTNKYPASRPIVTSPATATTGPVAPKPEVPVTNPKAPGPVSSKPIEVTPAAAAASSAAPKPGAPAPSSGTSPAAPK